MYVVGLYLAQVRGTRDADEVRAHLRDLQEVPDLIAGAARPDGAGARARPRARRTSSACCSSAATSATRWRSRARSSSRSWRTSRPRASRPGRSSTARSRSIEDGTPVIVIAPRHALQAKLVNNVQEVRARGARTIVLATDGDESATPYADHVIRIPDTKSLLTPLLTLVPLQVLLRRGRPGARARRRPAAQPGQVRHGRVARAERIARSGVRRRC